MWSQLEAALTQMQPPGRKPAVVHHHAHIGTRSVQPIRVLTALVGQSAWSMLTLAQTPPALTQVRRHLRVCMGADISGSTHDLLFRFTLDCT